MIEALTSLLIATTILLGSPGPATLSLAATGAVFGFGRGINFLAGILAGLLVAMILGSAGIAAVFTAYPSSRLFIQTLGAGYIIYIAIKIATAPVLIAPQGEEPAAPGFKDGFLINLLNPKAYAAFLALFSQFLLPVPGLAASYGLTSLVIFIIAIIVDTAWLGFGKFLMPLFQSQRFARATRVLLALMIVIPVLASLVPEFLS